MEDIPAYRVNVTDDEWRFFAESLRLNVTTRGQMLVFDAEKRQPIRLLNPPGWRAVLVRIKGIIQWWPECAARELPGEVEILISDGTGPTWSTDRTAVAG